MDNKITWDFSKDRLPEGTTSIIICNKCGWLISNPKLEDKGKKPPFDENCPGCGKSFKETKSEEKRFEQPKGKK